jgi:hypothetical protein
MVPDQMPEWPVSTTTVPFSGNASEIAWQSRSGRIGSADEVSNGVSSARQPLNPD